VVLLVALRSSFLRRTRRRMKHKAACPERSRMGKWRTKIMDSQITLNQSRPKAESILFSPLHCRAGSHDKKNAKRTQFSHYPEPYVVHGHPQHTYTHLAPRVTGHGPRVTSHAKQTQFAEYPETKK
jgi:hypothetical protein